MSKLINWYLWLAKIYVIIILLLAIIFGIFFVNYQAFTNNFLHNSKLNINNLTWHFSVFTPKLFTKQITLIKDKNNITLNNCSLKVDLFAAVLKQKLIIDTIRCSNVTGTYNTNTNSNIAPNLTWLNNLHTLNFKTIDIQINNQSYKIKDLKLSTNYLNQIKLQFYLISTKYKMIKNIYVSGLANIKNNIKLHELNIHFQDSINLKLGRNNLFLYKPRFKLVGDFKNLKAQLINPKFSIINNNIKFKNLNFEYNFQQQLISTKLYSGVIKYWITTNKFDFCNLNLQQLNLSLFKQHDFSGILDKGELYLDKNNLLGRFYLKDIQLKFQNYQISKLSTVIKLTPSSILAAISPNSKIRVNNQIVTLENNALIKINNSKFHAIADNVKIKNSNFNFKINGIFKGLKLIKAKVTVKANQVAWQDVNQFFKQQFFSTYFINSIFKKLNIDWIYNMHSPNKLQLITKVNQLTFKAKNINLKLKNINLFIKDSITKITGDIADLKAAKLVANINNKVSSGTINYYGNIDTLEKWLKNLSILPNELKLAKGKLKAKFSWQQNNWQASLNLIQVNYNFIHNLSGIIKFNDKFISSNKLIAKIANNNIKLKIKNNKNLFTITGYSNVSLNQHTAQYLPLSAINGKIKLNFKLSTVWPIQLDNNWLLNASSDLLGLNLQIKDLVNKSYDKIMPANLIGTLNKNRIDLHLKIDNWLNSFYFKIKDKQPNIGILLGYNPPLYRLKNTGIEVAANLKSLPILPNITITNNNSIDFSCTAIIDNLNIMQQNFSKSLLHLDYINNKLTGKLLANNAKLKIYQPAQTLILHFQYLKPQFTQASLQDINLLLPKTNLIIDKLTLANNSLHHINLTINNPYRGYFIIDPISINDQLIKANGLLIINHNKWNLLGNFNSDDYAKFNNYLQLDWLQHLAGNINLALNGKFGQNWLQSIVGDIKLNLQAGAIKINNTDFNQKLAAGKILTYLSIENLLNILNPKINNSKNIFNFNNLVADISTGVSHYKINSASLNSSIVKIIATGIANTKQTDLILGIKPKFSASLPMLALLGFGMPVGLATLALNKIIDNKNYGFEYFKLSGKFDKLFINKLDHATVKVKNLNGEINAR